MPSDLPFASVVVPTRNRAAGLLRRCLKSLLAQDYPPDRYEVIVINDGSTDNTSEVVARFAGRETPPVRYVPQPHGGLNSARNAGIAAARGDPICFVDDDVEAPPGWLSALVSGALRHPEAGCFGGPIRLRLEGTPPRLRGHEPLGESELNLRDAEGEDALVWGANMAVRRSALAQVGAFDEELPISGDEQEWEERLLDAGGKIRYIADAWLWHLRTQEDLRLTTMMRRRFIRGMHRIFYLRKRGLPLPTVRGELISALRVVGHAVRRRCAWGLLAAAGHVGAAWAPVVEGRRR